MSMFTALQIKALQEATGPFRTCHHFPAAMNPLDVNSEPRRGYFGSVQQAGATKQQDVCRGQQSMSHWYTVATRCAAGAKEGSSDTAGSGAISERWAGCKSILWMEKDKAHAGLSLLAQIDRLRGKRGERCSLKSTLPANKRPSIHPSTRSTKTCNSATLIALQAADSSDLIRSMVLAKS